MNSYCVDRQTRCIGGHLITGICVALLYSVLFLPYAAAAENEVVLRVNGKPVYSDEMDSAINLFVPAAAYHGGVSAETRERYREQALDFLVGRELLYQEAVRQKMDLEDRVDQEFQGLISSYGSRSAFQKALKAAGLEEDMMRARLRKDILATAYAEREAVGNVTYSDDELQAYYTKNQSAFQRPPSVNLWHIIMKVPANASAAERDEKRDMAAYVADLAREGEVFEVLAEKYSEDEYRVVGGKLGLVHKGQLDPEIEKVAFSLDEGKTAGPIETIYGFHIIKAGSRVEGELVPFERIRDKLKSELEAKRIETFKDELIGRLKQGATIEILK